MKSQVGECFSWEAIAARDELKRVRPGRRRITFKVKCNGCTISELGGKIMVILKIPYDFQVTKSFASFIEAECGSFVNIL